MKKEIDKIGKNEEKITKTRTLKLKYIDTVRFVATSLSDLVENLSDGIHKAKCK